MNDELSTKLLQPPSLTVDELVDPLVITAQEDDAEERAKDHTFEAGVWSSKLNVRRQLMVTDGNWVHREPMISRYIKGVSIGQFQRSLALHGFGANS